ncbi:hypothetical protein LTR37_017246 [Vermiconidia calcicola]|uniref:Uncharacterized protein n=1 Tax=Vermiconidia calcicola TaxID=1690605 RepID=A0ACC3MKP1_9PEZI|nr:hypothetical protein LTR37_017246 [Vermiconidia calcicola]
MAAVMDSNKLNVQCTYPDCSKYFETEQDMKYHKKSAPEHDYCKKCDVDCLDFDDLTQHKVSAMQPFLEGRMRHNKDVSPAHIVCEFCGMDFKSFGGRDKHRKTIHPADQNIVCPGNGCGYIFVKASALIAHFEDGACCAISNIDYLRNVQARHVKTMIMKKPDEFLLGLQVNAAYAPASDRPGEVDDFEDQDSDPGGVAILDQEDEAQKGGYKPLHAEIRSPLIEMNNTAPLTRKNLETWPRMPSQAPSPLTESMRSMSISSTTQSINGSQKSASEFASEITSRRGGTKVYTESYPSLSSSAKSLSITGDDGKGSVVAGTAASTTGRSVAWTTGKTSRALFKDAKPTPPAGDWAAHLKQRENDALAKNSNNLLYSRVWDPQSNDYSVDRFLHSVTGKYTCPFPDCEDDYEDPVDLEGHLQLAHLTKDFRCPQCLKIFKKGSALIAHAESAGGKCKVKDTTKFHDLLDEVSGGFLEAEDVKQPKILKMGKAVVKAGEEPADGVMSMKFSAKSPGPRW